MCQKQIDSELFINMHHSQGLTENDANMLPIIVEIDSQT